MEFQFESPEPLPQEMFAPFPLDLNEVHLDPLTGENERAQGWGEGGFADLTPAQRETLPVSALPGEWERTGRNAVCPCGSGKKFKHCHGALV